MKSRDFSAASLAVAAAVLSAVAGTGTPAAASAGGPGCRCAPQTAYIANERSGTVTPISTRTNTAGPPIHTGEGPFRIAITPGGRDRLSAGLGEGGEAAQ